MSRPEHTGYLDIHSHLLPGMDDGTEDYGQCLAVADHYLAIGVEQVIATPHWIQGTGWAPTPEQVRTRAAEAEARIRKAGMELRVLPGMEISITDFLCGHFAASDFVALGEKGVFLIEYPLHSAVSAPTAEAMRCLLERQRECRFVIAHPERCFMFQDNPGRLLDMVSIGMLTQVNIGSILGSYGRTVRQTALGLLNAGLVHLLATDTHGRAGRMPPGPKEMDELARIIGTENVAEGFRDNPRRLLAGEPILPLHPGEAVAGSCHFPPVQGGLVHSLLQFFREH